MLVFGGKTAKQAGSATQYSMLTGWLCLLWLCYPIAWGLDDGANQISVRSGWIFFGILDVLMVPLLAYTFMALQITWDYR